MTRAPLDAALKVHPFKLKDLYFVQCPDLMDKKSFVQWVAPNLLNFTGSFTRAISTMVAGDTRAEIMSKLQEHGFSESGLPPHLGGTCDVETWTQEEILDPILHQSRERATAELTCSPEKETASSLMELFRSRGNTNALTETSHRKSAPSDLDALEKLGKVFSRIPLSERLDLAEATRQAPTLVQNESNPCNFLWCENYNSEAAARRLIKYWKTRRELFGSRAFLPLTTASPYGALSEEDLAAIDSGFLLQLPKTGDGQAVLFFDYEKMKATSHATDARVRAFFYFTHVITSESSATSSDVVTIHAVSDPSVRSELGESFNLIVDSAPVNFDGSHFVCLEKNKSGSSFLLDMFAWVQRCLWNKDDDSRTWVHVAQSKSELFEKLAPYGFTKEGLPCSLSGEWDNFESWKRERYRIDQANSDSLGFKLTQASLTTSSERKRMTRDFESFDGNSSKRSNHSHNALDASDKEAMLSRGLEQLEEAISGIPEAEKCAFVEARKVAPEVVDKETPFKKFLESANFDVWLAAAKVTKYWNLRKEVYGDRAFLPMNQTGEGTLNRDDIAMLSTGYAVILGYNPSGNATGCWDTSRRISHDPLCRRRVGFYLFSVLLESSTTPETNLDVIAVLGKPTLDRTVPEMLDIVEALQLKVASCHIVNNPELENGRTFFSTVLPIFSQLVKPFVPKTIKIHFAATKAELAEKLEAEGFRKEIIPKGLGGSWNYDEFPQWLEARCRYGKFQNSLLSMLMLRSPPSTLSIPQPFLS